MFGDQQFYESKVFLKSLKDAQNCLQEAAEYEANLKQYAYQQARLNEIKQQKAVNFHGETVKQGPSFNDMKEVKQYQFSNMIFKKYFGGFDGYDHTDYQGFKELLNNGLKQMKQ